VQDNVLVFEDVSVAYSSGSTPIFALRDISLSVERGSFVAIIGQNGSGKSTLGRVMANLIGISRGSVRREGTSDSMTSDGSSRPSQRAFIQMVFQNPDAQIVGSTIYEDVCFGLENLGVPPEEMRARAEAALGQVGLLLPMDTKVEHLSGGQKQLLCIAGCLAMHPSVIVFDEATAMLDVESRQRIYQTVRALHQQGVTIVWITQWMDELYAADRVIVLDQGRMVYDGTPRDYFYGCDSYPHGHTQSPCRRFGFRPPFVVELTEHLARHGVCFSKPPVSEGEFAQNMEGLCHL
jgi:energy-coupling factor transporter ATP-binding protein EcfA2